MASRRCETWEAPIRIGPPSTVGSIGTAAFAADREIKVDDRLDASAEMLRTAQEAISHAKLSHRIVLAHALAEELTPALFGLDAPFDHAIFSYSLSMIPDWRGALRRGAQCVRAGGYVHVVDFGDLRALPSFASGALRAWLRLFHVAPRDQLLSWLESGIQARQQCSLRVWPGRYAFVMKANPATIAQLSA